MKYTRILPAVRFRCQALGVSLLDRIVEHGVAVLNDAMSRLVSGSRSSVKLNICCSRGLLISYVLDMGDIGRESQQGDNAMTEGPPTLLTVRWNFSWNFVIMKLLKLLKLPARLVSASFSHS